MSKAISEREFWAIARKPIGHRKDGSAIFAMAGGQEATAVAGPNIPATEANAPAAMVPFRRGTTERSSVETTTGPTAVTAAQQNVEEEIKGSGYIYGIDIDVKCTTAGNSANVAYVEDGPYSALASVIFKDVNGELGNVSGYHLYLYNKYGGYMLANNESSLDTNIWQKLTGTGGTGGSFRFHLFYPVGLNRRNLLGLLGNQHKAQSYWLRSDLAPSASIYSTAPSAAGNVTIERVYDNYSVPQKTNAQGAPQQQLPDKFGVLHFITQTVNPGAAPLGGSTINHYLPRTGNAIRLLILVFRANGSRATAESNMPTRISFKLGDTNVYSETVAYRRKLMYDRYGFDAPSGVLVYDALHDVHMRSGAEFGDDWWFTQGLVNVQVEITYPSGFGSTANTLTVITGDLQIPPNVDVFA